MKTRLLAAVLAALAAPTVGAAQFDVTNKTQPKFEVVNKTAAKKADGCRCVGGCDCPDPCPCDGEALADCFVLHKTGNGSVEGGSGTPVAVVKGKTLILTCAHVIPAGTTGPITVTTRGKTYPARVVAASAVSWDHANRRMSCTGPDLCLLEIDAALPVVKLAAAVTQDTPVYAWGFDGAKVGDPPALREGRTTVMGTVETQLGMKVEAGDSGAGLLNHQGELVGVVCGRNPNGWPLAAAVPLQTVRDFIDVATGKKAAPVRAAAPAPAPAQAACPTGTCPRATPVQYGQPLPYGFPIQGGCQTGRCPNAR